MEAEENSTQGKRRTSGSHRTPSGHSPEHGVGGWTGRRASTEPTPGECHPQAERGTARWGRQPHPGPPVPRGPAAPRCQRLRRAAPEPLAAPWIPFTCAPQKPGCSSAKALGESFGELVEAGAGVGGVEIDRESGERRRGIGGIEPLIARDDQPHRMRPQAPIAS